MNIIVIIIFFLLSALISLPLISLPDGVGFDKSILCNINDVRPLGAAMFAQDQSLRSYMASNNLARGDLTTSLTVSPPWRSVPGMVSYVGQSESHVIGITYYNSNRYRAADIVYAINNDFGSRVNVGITSSSGLITSQGIKQLPPGISSGLAAIFTIIG